MIMSNQVEMRGIDLYKLLMVMGPLPKTFHVEYLSTGLDTVTGKKRHNARESSKHAIVTAKLNKKEMSVDYIKLRDFAKKCGKGLITISFLTECLHMESGNCNFYLYDTKATAAATIDFDTGEVTFNPNVVNGASSSSE